MKKKFIGLALAVFMMLSVSLVVYAGPGEGCTDPPGCSGDGRSIILYPSPYCPDDDLIKP